MGCVLAAASLSAFVHFKSTSTMSSPYPHATALDESKDIEKDSSVDTSVLPVVDSGDAKPVDNIENASWLSKLTKGNHVEIRGVQPVPEDERQDPQYLKQFYHWFGADVNILCFSTGGIATFVMRVCRDCFRST